MSEVLKVKDEPDLVRDSKGIIQNTNTSAYRDYIARRDLVNQDRLRIEALERDNAEIKDSLSMIIKLLKGV